METNENDPAQSGHGPPDGDGFDRFLEDLRAPLSVIHAYTQMLQRRILKGWVYDERHLLARLAVIEQSTKVIGERLQEQEDRIRH